MLTRIEIDGFKSFEGFGLDLAPFSVLLGSNASGKSNLFDAIQFLSRLAGAEDLRSAAKGLRGEAHELFRQVAPGEEGKRMKFAAELLLEPVVRDPWGKAIELTHTRVRYELELERVGSNGGPERLVVARECVLPILAKSDNFRPYGAPCSPAFRRAHLKFSRKSAWLETTVEGGQTAFRIHQDGSQGRTRPAVSAEATVLSTMRTADFPHLFALREEFRAWRLLQLDPVELRKPSELLGEDAYLLPDGSNLAAVLHRMQSETRTETRPNGVLPEIAARVSTVIPGFVGLSVERVEAARQYRASVTLRDGLPFPTSVVSDGTLRVLALLTLLADPRQHGLVCFEEPENGIHPARLRTLLEHLRRRTTDPRHAEGDEEPLTQILMNSHSPVVLSALVGRAEPERRTAQILFADTTAVVDGPGASRRRTRVRDVASPDEGLFPPGQRVLAHEVERYLATVDREG